jgi:hypothetical protein
MTTFFSIHKKAYKLAICYFSGRINYSVSNFKIEKTEERFPLRPVEGSRKPL